MTPTNQPQPSTADLLRFADLIQGYARRLENLATWRDVLQRDCDAQAAGEHLAMAALLRSIQASRADGLDGDGHFVIICHMAEDHAETIFDTDPELKELSAKMKAVEQREGLTELDGFDPDDPETPADWKAFNDQWHGRFQEVEKIREDRLIGWLRRHGEIDMAELYLNDRAEYDRRREAGREEVHGPLPDLNTDIGEGDTGVTEVVTEGK